MAEYSYAVNMGVNTSDLVRGVNEISDVMSKYNESDTWKKTLAMKIAYMQNYMQHIRILTAPTKYKDIHNEALKACDYFMKQLCII
jgi:hypothetical protein